MIVNQILAAATRGQPEPEIGMGATILYVTDRHACTVVLIYKGLTHPVIGVKRDKITPAPGHNYYGNQRYTYEPMPEAKVEFFRFRKDRWEEVTKDGRADRRFRLTGSCTGLRIGERDEYRDPHF